MRLIHWLRTLRQRAAPFLRSRRNSKQRRRSTRPDCAHLRIQPERLEDRTLLAVDFGDAPAPYPTTLGENGARHTETGPTLGTNRDVESDGIHSASANADDTTGSADDEDGVTFGTIRVGQLDASVTINVGGVGVTDGPTIAGHFGVSLLAEVDQPGDLAVAPQNSGFDLGLYVLNFFPGTNVGGDGVTRVAPDGTTSLIASLLAEADPIGLAFPPDNSVYGDFLYVSSNNRDGGRGGDQGGAIQRIDTGGSVTDFTAVGVPNGPGEPVGITFASVSGSERLLLANSTDVPGDVLDVGIDGTLQVFVNDGQFHPNGMSIREVAFSSSGAFGEFFYAAESASDTVIRLDINGNVIDTFANLPAGENVQGVEFARGGSFGTDLYIRTDSRIYRAESDGTVTLFADDFSV